MGLGAFAISRAVSNHQSSEPTQNRLPSQRTHCRLQLPVKASMPDSSAARDHLPIIAEHARVDDLPGRRADVAFLVFDQVERLDDPAENGLAAVEADELRRALETVRLSRHGLPSVRPVAEVASGTLNDQNRAAKAISSEPQTSV
jgi:hypothetical protein